MVLLNWSTQLIVRGEGKEIIPIYSHLPLFDSQLDTKGLDWTDVYLNVREVADN